MTRYTPPDIRTLSPGEIFVFGSNLDGRHGKGAAKFANQKFGAQWGVAEGITGRCYALPTVGHNLSRMPIEDVEKHVNTFLRCTSLFPELTFLVTLVGCGLAGHKIQDIGPMFSERTDNVILPIEFHEAMQNNPCAESNAV